MKKKNLLICGFTFLSFSCNAQQNGPKIQSSTTVDYTYEIVTDNIDIPWGLTFLNKNEFLVTEKAGILYRVVDGVKTEVQGLPPVYVRGQGGLLDIAIAPNYQETGIIYFTTSSPLGEDKG